MHLVLLGLAAGAAVIVSSLSPAAVQSAPGVGIAVPAGTHHIRVGSPGRAGQTGDFGRHRDDHRVDGTAAGWAYGGYNDYGDYDANRSFAEDKWNDWWHDRPDRAYPRWMSRNQNCQRQWYSGDVLTC